MVNYTPHATLWKNSEDEVLKAAVQKYGQQQWGRVASLLNQKTAKQAKARWYEWIDPSIRKSAAWSTSEDEKLLHLAQYLPSQWKTIAPLVGSRTAVQCRERYQQLLSQATGETTEGQQAAVGSSIAHPESQPARPDAVDMDEAELEMLQEARARLANTVGKKAKRKQREKALLQAKRLANLQKRRELKQAGLMGSGGRRRRPLRGKRKKYLDTMHEIPFYKPAPAGLHDTSSEKEMSAQLLEKRRKNVNLRRVNENQYRTRDQAHANAQKREKIRMQLLRDTNEKYGEQAGMAKNEEDRRPGRGVLRLPKPMGAEDAAVVMSPPLTGASSGGVTEALTADFRRDDESSLAALPSPSTGTKVQRGEDWQTTQARQLAAWEKGTTPILGEVTEPSPTDEEEDAATTMTDAMTDAASVGTFASSAMSIRELARRQRRLRKEAAAQIQAALAELPVAEYDYELEAPATAETVDEDDQSPFKRVRVEDQAQVEASERAAKKLRLEEELRAQSTVIQRSLPRPAVVLDDLDPVEDDLDAQIELEALRMLQHDAFEHPVAIPTLPTDKKSKKSKKRKHKDETATFPVVPPRRVELDDIPPARLLEARKLIETECKALIEEKLMDVIRDAHATTQEAAWQFLVGETMRVRPSPKRSQDVASVESCPLAATTAKERNDKKDTKRQVLTKGYVQRAESLAADLAGQFGDIKNAEIEVNVYSSLESDHEIPGMAQRIASLEKEINALKQQEVSMQQQYGDLMIERRRRQAAGTSSAP